MDWRLIFEQSAVNGGVYDEPGLVARVLPNDALCGSLVFKSTESLSFAIEKTPVV